MKRSIERELGIIIGGSLVEGLGMKINPNFSVEDLRAGEFVVIEGEQNEFFSMVTDIQLNQSHSQIVANPPTQGEELIKKVLSGSSTYATVILKPMLMVDTGDDHRPVKTIPPHFVSVYKAENEDVNRIFHSEEEDVRYFNIGTPIDMTTPVCIDLDRFVERSNGIFGKTGTGKSFLTRIFLSGLIKSEKAVNLIFDMHNEYGYKSATEEGDRAEVKGLKQLLGDRVAIFTLDPESSRRREVKYDFEVQIPYSSITIDDILLLQDELNLTTTAAESAHILNSSLGEDWIWNLLNMGKDDVRALTDRDNINRGAVLALQRKLRRLEGLSFLKQKVVDNAVERMMDLLTVRGVNIVLEFGQYKDILSYMLVASILTRQIRNRYEKMTEESLGKGLKDITPLVITIEEAHKFLNPTVSKQTIFGTIAREMRKYNVTLLVVDQRPSGIDSEVISQLGTRITALLNDEKDIEAVLTGVSGSTSLRGVLASLDTKKQTLIIGHAVPMPIVIQVREYDTDFYKAISIFEDRERFEKQVEEDLELYSRR